MALLLLAPAIQEAILLGEIAPKDKELRKLARVMDWESQESQFRTAASGLAPPPRRSTGATGAPGPPW